MSWTPLISSRHKSPTGISGEVRVSFKTGSLNFFRVAIERARMPDWMKGPVENLAPFQLLVGYSEHVGLVRVLPDGDVMVKCAPCPARNLDDISTRRIALFGQPFQGCPPASHPPMACKWWIEDDDGLTFELPVFYFKKERAEREAARIALSTPNSGLIARKK